MRSGRWLACSAIASVTDGENRQRIGLIPNAEGGLVVRLHEDFGRILQFCAAGEHKRPAPAVVDPGADYR
jgi:hypothetical protein